MNNFDALGLNSVLAKSLARMKYDTPTPIQAKAIPFALEGRDVMGSAQTGTGKTAAFSVPLVEFLLNNERGTALVMTPTRELGKQVMEVMHQMLGPKSRIKTAFLIGGESMSKQCSQLRNRPRLVVGTPGRINDHLERGNLDLDDARFLVLDEMDRMLDMGFSIQIDRIVKYMPSQRQTLMFSATMPSNIIKMADKYLDNPERVSVGSTINPAKNIKQEVLLVTTDSKYKTLVGELHERQGSIIVFVKTKRGADKMAKRLNDEQLDARPIHGDLQQRKRDRVISEYRKGNFRILVATDVVSRGLDIPHVEHVINYDLPQVPEDYIHRIGRTARAGAKGNALCLISPQDSSKWRAIEVLMDPSKKSARGPARNDNKKGKPRRSSGKNFESKGRRFESRDGEGRGEDRKFSKGKSFSKDSRRSRDDRSERSEGGNSFSKDRKFNKDSRPESRDGESRRGGEDRKFSKGKSFNKDSRRSHDDHNDRSEGRRDKRTDRSEAGKPFNKDKKFNRDSRPESRDGESRRGGEDRKFSKGKSFSKDSRRSHDDRSERSEGGKSFSKNKNFSKDSRRPKEGGNSGDKPFSRNNKSRRSAA